MVLEELELEGPWVDIFGKGSFKLQFTVTRFKLNEYGGNFKAVMLLAFNSTTRVRELIIQETSLTYFF